MMEQLSIKEKAKRFDEVLAMAKECITHIPDDAVNKYMLSMFPELAESENERIRKAILELVKQSSAILDKRNQNNMIAWLEKQKTSEDALQYLKENHSPSEVSDFQAAMNIAVAKAYDKGIKDGLEKQGEKSVKNIESDKAESKFKVGDWITFYGDKPFKILKIEAEVNGILDYLLLNQNGHHHFYNKKYVDENARLWTLQDAKDGDVLFQDLMGGKTFIYNGVNPNMAILYSFIISNDGEDVLPYHIGKPNTGIGYIEENKNIVHPATKEQRDLLFTKMKEAGYVWYADKKELKKIPNAFEECKIVHIEHGKYYYCIKDYYAGGNKRASKGDVVQALNGMNMMALGVKANEYFVPVNNIKQISAWSEEDELMFKQAIYVYHQIGYTAVENWLKSLKQRMGG